MKLNIKATNFVLTPAIRDYIEKKMEKTEKYLSHVKFINLDIEVELTTKHHHKGEIFRAEANLEVAGDLLRVEKVETDLYKAIDSMESHLVDLITKYKEKRIAKKRKAVNADA